VDEAYVFHKKKKNLLCETKVGEQTSGSVVDIYI